MLSSADIDIYLSALESDGADLADLQAIMSEFVKRNAASIKRGDYVTVRLPGRSKWNGSTGEVVSFGRTGKAKIVLSSGNFLNCPTIYLTVTKRPEPVKKLDPDICTCEIAFTGHCPSCKAAAKKTSATKPFTQTKKPASNKAPKRQTRR
jgi:hypothetical protein